MRRLTAELRRLREGLNLTSREVAKQVGISVSTVSRIENTGQGLSRDALVELLTLYKVPRAKRQGLLRLMEQLNEPGLLDRGDLRTNEDTANWIGLEQDAARICNYESLLIPGLLQTFPYAKALFDGGESRLSEQERTGRTNARIARQSLLRRRTPLDFRVVLHEAALRETVGGPEVMHGQLVHLLEAACLPGVDLRVLPFGRGAHAGLTSPFVIMDYRGLPSLVLLENKVADLYLEEKADIAAYRLYWQDIWGLAHTPDKSSALIREVARTLHTAEKGHGSGQLAQKQL
ncbi:helix-turn-helix transcriptional regulator [Kibdelosporangium persicum]